MVNFFPWYFCAATKNQGKKGSNNFLKFPAFVVWSFAAVGCSHKTDDNFAFLSVELFRRSTVLSRVCRSTITFSAISSGMKIFMSPISSENITVCVFNNRLLQSKWKVICIFFFYLENPLIVRPKCDDPWYLAIILDTTTHIENFYLSDKPRYNYI